MALLGAVCLVQAHLLGTTALCPGVVLTCIVSLGFVISWRLLEALFHKGAEKYTDDAVANNFAPIQVVSHLPETFTAEAVAPIVKATPAFQDPLAALFAPDVDDFD
jgi:hypothetical protein